MNINWTEIKNFKSSEFAEDPTELAEPQLLLNLDRARDLLKQKIFPSPIKGSLARLGGSDTSQHYIGPKNDVRVRKTTASDVFIEGTSFSNYSNLVGSGLFKGIGIYLDTNGPDGMPWVMTHVDIRPKGFGLGLPLIWIVERIWNAKKKRKMDTYRYPQAHPQYWRLFSDSRLFETKQFRIPKAPTVNADNLGRVTPNGTK